MRGLDHRELPDGMADEAAMWDMTWSGLIQLSGSGDVIYVQCGQVFCDDLFKPPPSIE